MAAVASPVTQPALRSDVWPRLRAAIFRFIPEGRPLPEDVWRSRHRGIVILLWLHIPALWWYGVVSLGQPGHVSLEISAIVGLSILASWPWLGRYWRTLAASAGLITCSAILVHFSGGIIEMHFHFFVMVAVVTLYQSWSPYLLAIAYVAIHHGVVGVLEPQAVYDHRDAWLHPWKWAGIHAAFVLGASFAGITSWRLNERLHARVEALNEDLEKRVVERTAQLEATNRELDAANSELEAFSYSVSHDLRAPLRAIGGFSEILLSRHAAELDASGQEYLHRVRDATGRMSTLIDSMLDLAHVHRVPLHFDRVDLTAIARAIAAELQRSAPDRSVTIVVADGLTARGDQRLLHAVLQNLLSNAWKFTAKHPRAHIEVGFTESEGTSAYFVRDDGAGFDPEFKDKLFLPFQRLHTNAEFEGTGVGLATVDRIVARHGGRVWATSEPEQGATFYFTLAD